MEHWNRAELAKSLIYIGVSDQQILRRFRDFDDFDEEETKRQLAKLRSMGE